MIFGKKAAFIGAILVVVCWPFASGQLAQKQVEARLGNMQYENMEIQVTRYERGYLSSEIETKITAINDLKDFMHSYELPSSLFIKTKLIHGFLNVFGEANIIITPEWQSALAPFGQLKKSPMTADFDLSIFGDIAVEAFTKEINTKYKELSIQVTPIVISSLMGRDKSTFFTSTIPKLTLGEGHDKLILHDLSFIFDGSMRGSIWMGQQEMNFSSIEFLKKEKTLANVSQFSAKSQNIFQAPFVNEKQVISEKKSEENARIKSLNQIKISKFFIENGGEYQSIALGLKVKNIDFSILKQMAQVYEDSAIERKNDSLILPFISLLAKGIDVEISPIQMRLPEGVLKGNVHLYLESHKNQEPTDLLAFSDKLKGEVKLHLPNGLINKLPFLSAVITRLTTAGFSSSDKENTAIDIRFGEGKVIAQDGNSLPLSAFPFLLM